MRAQALGIMKRLEFLTGHLRESSSVPAYIVAIGWLYVVALMIITQKSLLSGVMTLICYGSIPLEPFLWIAGTHQRQ
jgi:hypothetical protein